MSRQNIDFGFGECVSYDVSTYWNISDDVPNAPGIYAWFFRINKVCINDSFETMKQFYQQMSLDVEVTGNIYLKYKGQIGKRHEDAEECRADLMERLMIMCSYPLYIGVSKDLNKRLQTHKDNLERFIASQYDETLEDEGPDTDSESATFGHRIGKVLAQNNAKSLKSLYVKYLDLSDLDPSREELLKAEKLANTLFNPVFGRR